MSSPTTITNTKPSEAPESFVKPNGTRITVSHTKPAPRRQKRAQKPIIIEPKKPATMFELRIGRWSFVLSFVNHPKETK